MKETILFIALMLLLAAAPLSALTTEKTPGTKAPETAQQREQTRRVWKNGSASLAKNWTN